MQKAVSSATETVVPVAARTIRKVDFVLEQPEVQKRVFTSGVGVRSISVSADVTVELQEHGVLISGPDRTILVPWTGVKTVVYG